MPPRTSLRILFLVSAHNSLSQRALIALTERRHRVEVAVVDGPEEIEAAVARHRPELIVCPMLKKLIPESIWSRYRCLIVHPGPPGDRGLEEKRRRRAADERVKPLEAYRAEEMARSHECFYGPDRSYHEARWRFTRKLRAVEATAEQPSIRLAA